MAAGGDDSLSRRIWRSFNCLIVVCMILQSTSSLLQCSWERCMASGSTDFQVTDREGERVCESCQQVSLDGS